MSERLGTNRSSDKRAQILALSFAYSLLGTLLSLASLGSTVKAPFYIVFPILFIVSAVSGFIASNLLPDHGIQFPWQRALKLATLLLLALIGFAGLVFSFSLMWHFDTVLDLTRVIEPGVFGGLAFLAIQILAGLTLFIARASSGELLSPNLESVGPHWYLMPLALSLEIGLGVAIFLYTPVVISKVRNFRAAK
jgi:NADH:ubiquinone oxidoreductase subunit 6 (subunit J)